MRDSAKTVLELFAVLDQRCDDPTERAMLLMIAACLALRCGGAKGIGPDEMTLLCDAWDIAVSEFDIQKLPAEPAQVH